MTEAITKKEFTESVTRMIDKLKNLFIEDLDLYCPGDDFDPAKGALVLQEAFLTYMLICYAGSYMPKGDKAFLNDIEQRCTDRLKAVRKNMKLTDTMDLPAPKSSKVKRS